MLARAYSRLGESLSRNLGVSHDFMLVTHDKRAVNRGGEELAYQSYLAMCGRSGVRAAGFTQWCEADVHVGVSTRLPIDQLDMPSWMTFEDVWRDPIADAYCTDLLPEELD